MQIGNESVFATRENAKMDKIQSYAKMDLKNAGDKKLREVCQEFESIFIYEMFKSMKQTLGDDRWLHGGFQQDVFEDMLYSEYAKESSKQGGIGLADLVYEFLKPTSKQQS
jgi:flagellar protein FlgJ